MSLELFLKCWIVAYILYACLHCCILRLIIWNLVHACSYYCYSQCFHLVFGSWGSFEQVIEVLNWFKLMHVMFELCSWKIGLKLDLIELPLDFDFSNWSLKHVILWVYKSIPEYWPKRIEFGVLKLVFELEVQIWKFQILDSRSSGVTGARVWNSCIPHCTLFYSPL